MTRAIHGRYLKEESGAISDHLRNHVHLTNCIHLKNHMHRQSPILAERSLMRDLIALQRSRSLRDPSTSPPSWHSPSILDALSKKIDREAEGSDGRRRSTGLENRREARRLSKSSGPVGSAATSKVAAAEAVRFNDGGTVLSERSSMSKVRDAARKTHRRNASGGIEEAFHEGPNSSIANDVVLGKAEGKTKKKTSPKGKQSLNVHPKSLSKQLNEVPLHSEEAHSSHLHFRGPRQDKTSEEPEASIHNHRNDSARMRKRRSRGVRRARAASGLRDFGFHNELSTASNSLAQSSTQHTHYAEGGDRDSVKQDIRRDPRNACGIPWNWSRIHHRGKTILDIAGRSLSCGLSDSRLRREGSISQGGLDMPFSSNHSSSSTNFDAEATPLLVESLGSQESGDKAPWVHEYSGELGIFANHRVKRDADSDFSSESRSREQHKLRRNLHGRHQSLTQKYVPRTFRDLVGQNLTAQALSNAVSKRKVGFLYVFYGPHGTGKTSCARIFARALNCQSLEHPKPCGICGSCVAHDLGKNRNVKEVGPVGNFDFENLMDVLDNITISQLQSQYRVFIFDDCDSLPPSSWSVFSKIIDRAPRRVVFVLISTSLDHLPHMIISRCQKFFFPKLKDADIIYTLQWISTKEDLEIDRDALKLIASRSDGSLRDAEMTLEQLSLLGQRISVPLVQELVGLISDEKLVDLLDLALSADTVNTVKNLREIMEAGGEPLALMTQLATIITDILAGSYVFTQERLRQKFFRRPTLSKDDMEKLRQALRTLSEAEKQLRTSNDKLTWLTAALLQLAPDQQYVGPNSSTETSFNHSPFVLRSSNRQGTSIRDTSGHPQMYNNGMALLASNKVENRHGSTSHVPDDDNVERNIYLVGGKNLAGVTPKITDIVRSGSDPVSGKQHKEIQRIWFSVLEKIRSNALKQFMCQEGKLVSISFGSAQTVQLTFSSQMTTSKAEKYREYILKAFESVLGSPLTVEIRCEPIAIPASDDGSSRMIANQISVTGDRMPKAGYQNNPQRVSNYNAIKGEGYSPSNLMHSDIAEMGKGEIIEIAESPREPGFTGLENNPKKLKGKGIDTQEPFHKQSSIGHLVGKSKIGEQPQSQSLVRSKVSLAHVIQQAEGTQRNGWSRRKAISIAEKLEQENLRLEPRSRSLLCWKSSRATRGKLSRLRIRTRRPRSLLKFFPCARYLPKSPR